MNKIKLSMVVLLIITILTPAPISAFETNDYYVETVIETIDNVTTRAASTKTGKKTTYVKQQNGTILWSVSITANFTYNGSSATCTSSSASATSNTSTWRISSYYASRSNNRATGTALVKKYVNGINTASQTTSVTIYCSKTGILS